MKCLVCTGSWCFHITTGAGSPRERITKRLPVPKRNNAGRKREGIELTSKAHTCTVMHSPQRDGCVNEHHRPAIYEPEQQQKGKMKIEIKHRWKNRIVFACEAYSLKEALQKAAKEKCDLRDSNLRGSYLSDSDLSGSDLSDSDLSGSNLSGSNLRGSNLSGSDLRGSNLSGSDLRDSNLRGSYLSGSDLSDSNLSGSDLSGSDLSDSDLSGSNLSGSNLSGSYLSGSYLSDSNLSVVRADFISEVLRLPNELEFLKTAIAAGKIDGSTYSGECRCLAGTLARSKGIEKYNGEPIKNGLVFHADSMSPRERLFMCIRKGDTPENHPISKIEFDWTQEAIEIRDNIRNTVSVK